MIGECDCVGLRPWVAAGVTVAGVASRRCSTRLAGGHGEQTWAGVAWAAAALASSGVGLVLAVRRTGNPIGWLLLANGLVLTAHQVATPYADYTVLEDPGALPGGEWAVLLHERAWPTLFICPTVIALVFPDGRLPSPRWRPVAMRGRGLVSALIVVSLLSAERYSDSSTTSRARSRSCPSPSSGCPSRSAGWARWPRSWRPRWRCGHG